MSERDEIISALDKVGLKLIPLDSFRRDLRPVKSAYKIEVPVDIRGRALQEVAETLTLLKTPRAHSYGVEFVNAFGGGIILSQMGVAELTGATAAHAGRALQLAAEYEPKEIRFFNVIKAIITCFPEAWNWGKDYEER